jgi:hypothetical protein
MEYVSYTDGKIPSVKLLNLVVKPLSYADIHNHLLTHEFLHKSSLLFLAANPPLLPTPSLLSSVHLAQQQTSFNFSRNRGRSRKS